MGAKGSSLFEEDPYCDNLIMDAVDLSIENYEELFGASLNYPDELFENENFDGLFGMKDIKSADSNCRGANAAEVGNWIMLALFLLHILQLQYTFHCLLVFRAEHVPSLLLLARSRT